MVERFTELHPTLIENERAMTRLWAKPEEQLRSVIDSTGGMTAIYKASQAAR